MNGADLAVIANNHAEFLRMPIEALALQMSRPAAIYDFWNCFTRTALSLPPGVFYFALGSHGASRRPAELTVKSPEYVLVTGGAGISWFGTGPAFGK